MNLGIEVSCDDWGFRRTKTAVHFHDACPAIKNAQSWPWLWANGKTKREILLGGLLLGGLKTCQLCWPTGGTK